MTREDRADIDQRDIMSESDPEGDRLDMNQLLRDCHNKTIRKKLENTNEKKPQLKKTQSKKETQPKFDHINRMSSSNIRQDKHKIRSQPKIQHSNILKNGQIYINEEKINPKKVSFSEKWK